MGRYFCGTAILRNIETFRDKSLPSSDYEQLMVKIVFWVLTPDWLIDWLINDGIVVIFWLQL